MNAEIEQIEALAVALSEKVGRREMTLTDFDKSYRFLRADLDPLVAEREQLAGGSIDGPTMVLSGRGGRHWDQADSVQEQRAMLIDAIGSDQVRVLPSIPGTWVHVFNPDRIVLGPCRRAPLTSSTSIPRRSGGLCALCDPPASPSLRPATRATVWSRHAAGR